MRMTESVSVILHFNVDYAEIARRMLSDVVKKSYDPMITALEEWSDGTICVNITGHSIEQFQMKHPELLERMRQLVENGTVEILATGYSHPILPLLPHSRLIRQVHDHVKLVKDVFGRTPKGAWPPELAVSPLVLKVFQDQGIEWVTVDAEHFYWAQELGNSFNLFERRDPTVTEMLASAFWAQGLGKLRAYWRAYKFLMKKNKEFKDPLRRVLISGESSMKALITPASLWNATQIALSGAVSIYSKKKHLKMILKHPSEHLPIYTSDVEFFGFRELGVPPPDSRSLIEFLKALQAEGIDVKSPSQLEDNAWDSDPKFLGSGSWAPDKSFRLWTESEDNRVLNGLLNEIYGTLNQLQVMNSDDEKIERLLRIAENSDARGWAPLPERKHEAYTALLSLYQLLETRRAE